MSTRAKRGNERVVEVQGLGAVTFRKSRRARHVRIQVRPYEGVRVTVPFRVSREHALRFLLQERRWVESRLREVRTVERRSLITGEQPIRTREHEVELRPTASAEWRISRAEDRICVVYPEESAVSDPRVQALIREALVAAYRREARAYLPARLATLAARHGFCYGRVFIKNLRSRWGSCSERNNINLNLHLMRLPDELVDYVLLHELVHTQVKHHGPNFWAALERVCPGAHAKDRRLRRFCTAF